MRPTFAIVIAALFSLGAQALEAPIEGYGVEDFEWEVESSPGNKLRVRGTIEEVANHVRSINPNYKQEISKRDDKGSLTGSLEQRYDKESIICYPNGWGAADGNKVQEGVEYLKNDVAGKPTNGPGPGNCGRTESKTLDSFREIGLAAEEICNKCWMSAVSSDSGFENLCAGQMFMKDKWNVIVRDAKC
ncbi:hypothetical protein ANOM_008227 [Aspergillus nomiae NRRL 13137]|uniref:Secreted protein n=1 Tax=Aspergillus nomiae NRRL (strain ATCC 15546 / NRRL 13137 / CBS 260.88 / M93) TaxID=1509407 RepID=A0A0L1IW92_ASPN3|nr:uncharacterized protein ANOM_008227 [Aspergillus nomiae NRRL 13137]KNG83767.1 hypothetical protein ANOM_008227 [Aspergillus nomiae NRRL 13137]